MTARSTSVGAVLLRAVLPQLAVVLLSLPFKSCGWDLTVVAYVSCDCCPQPRLATVV